MRGDKRANSARRRGSVLVEGSLVMVPLLAVLFGVLDLSIAIFVKNTVQFVGLDDPSVARCDAARILRRIRGYHGGDTQCRPTPALEALAGAVPPPSNSP
jgi:hypothetical protein